MTPPPSTRGASRALRSGVLSAVLACVSCTLETSPPEPTNTVQAAVSGRSPLDDSRFLAAPPTQGAPATYELMAGRLSRVPVSKAWSSSITLSGSHSLRLKSTGCQGNDDTGMVVTFFANGTPFTYYNDNHADGGGNGKCSALQLGARDGSITYTVTVFSKLRATVNLTLQVDEGKGAGFRNWVTGEQVGGALVRVGALQNGEFIEAQTPTHGLDGTTASDTTMLLFSVPEGFANSGTDFVQRAAPFSDDQGPDADPKIQINDATWSSTQNYVLMSKYANATATNLNVETPVDLVRGPVGTDLSAARGVGIELMPGRYYLSLLASQLRPVGHYTSSSNPHLSGNMPALDDDGYCPSVAHGDRGPDTNWYRGQHNQRAFLMQVQKYMGEGSGWVSLDPQRPVLRGAMGAEPDDGSGANWNRFVMELDVPTRATYRLDAIPLVSDVAFAPVWHALRNPQIGEFKLASANVFFGPSSVTGNEMKNYANLLATRGSILPSSKRVEERDDQAPFQWDVDVFGLQEANKIETAVNEADDTYTDVLLAEAKARSSHDWAYVHARGETWFHFAGIGDEPGMNPLYVRQSMWPGNGASGIYFSAGARMNGPHGGGGCSDTVPMKNANGEIEYRTLPYYCECHLVEGDDSGEIVNYMSAAKTRVFRDGTQDRPIAAFNLHLESSDGAADFNARFGELGDAINTIKDMLAAEPLAFNRSGNIHPKNSQNRIVIFGDWNGRTHQCGENYWIVRRLREQFGYAVDVAMATPDLAGNATLGMHTREDGYYGGNAQDWPVGFQYFDRTHGGLLPVIGWRNEMPMNYSSHSRYEQNDFKDHRKNALFPWWASTGRGKTSAMDKSGERYDMVMLVGKGWAMDDPVLEYKIMQDRNKNAATPGSLLDASGRGVEMWNSCNNTTDSVADIGTTGYVAFKSYAPNWNLGCGTEAGKPALHTDHRPVGVRLRVMDEGDVGGSGSCAHPICIQGSSLANGCDAPVSPPSCVSTICAADPYCCSNSWDATCVSEVASLCGKMCNAPSAGWTPFVSEEQAQGTTCGEDGNFVTAAKCRGDNCDDMSLYCSPSPAGLTTTPAYWTNFISEEAPNKSLTCDSNSSALGDLAISRVIDGIRATGSYADNVSVHCASLPSGHQLSACEWTPYFSEEAGTQVFPAGKVAAGIRCRGSYCDDLSYFVCAVN